ncbi:hypothetical protein HDE_02613 [Halotydeus destructor]|nr:hypothetical protein HDE_02613 [Halotydeus destructor]
MSSEPESAYSGPSGGPLGPESALPSIQDTAVGAVSLVLGDQPAEPPMADFGEFTPREIIYARTPLPELFELLVSSTIINGPEYLSILDIIKTKSLMAVQELDDVKRGSSTLIGENLALKQELDDTSETMDLLKKMTEEADKAFIEMEDKKEQEIFDLKSLLDKKTVTIAELTLRVNGYKYKTMNLQREVIGLEKEFQQKLQLVDSLQEIIDRPNDDVSSLISSCPATVRQFSFGFQEKEDQKVCVPPPDIQAHVNAANGHQGGDSEPPQAADDNANVQRHRNANGPPPLGRQAPPAQEPPQYYYDPELDRLSSPSHVEKQIPFYQPKDSFSAWSRNIEALADMHNWSDQCAIIVMVNRLSIEAMNMVSTRVDLSSIRDATFTQAREVFLKVFHQDDQGHAGLEKSRLFRQTKEMTGHDYYEKKRAVLMSWKPDANEDVIVSEIVSGLLPEVGIKVQEMAGLTKLSLSTLRDSLLRVETLDSKRKDLEMTTSLESKIAAQAKQLEQLQLQLLVETDSNLVYSKIALESPTLRDVAGQDLTILRPEESESSNDDVNVFEEGEEIEPFDESSTTESKVYINRVKTNREERKKLRRKYKKEAIRQLQDPNDPSWFTRFRTNGEVLLKANYITAVPVTSDHARAGNENVLVEVRQSFSLAFRRGCTSPNAIMNTDDNIILVLNASGQDQVLRNRDVVAEAIKASQDLVTFTVNGEDISDIEIDNMAAEPATDSLADIEERCKREVYSNWTKIRAKSEEDLPTKFDDDEPACRTVLNKVIANRVKCSTTSTFKKLDESMILVNDDLSEKDKESLLSLALYGYEPDSTIDSWLADQLSSTVDVDVIVNSSMEHEPSSTHPSVPIQELVLDNSTEAARRQKENEDAHRMPAQFKKKDLVLLDMGNKPLGLLKGLDYFNTGPYEIIDVMTDRPNTFKIKLPGKRKHPWVSGEHLRIYKARDCQLTPPQLANEDASHASQLSEAPATVSPETTLTLELASDNAIGIPVTTRRSKRKRNAPDRLNL